MSVTKEEYNTALVSIGALLATLGRSNFTDAYVIVCGEITEQRQQIASLTADLEGVRTSLRSADAANVTLLSVIADFKSDLEAAKKELEHQSGPLHDFAEDMNDEKQTLYIHHPSCHGSCEHSCDGIFVEGVQRTAQRHAFIFAPRTLQEANQSLEADLAAAREAIRAFVDKWDIVKPAIDGAFTIAHIHGMPYRGPSIADELTRLREHLRIAEQEKQK